MKPLLSFKKRQIILMSRIEEQKRATIERNLKNFNMKLNKAVYETKDGNSAWTKLCLFHTKHEGVMIIILSSTVINSEGFKECRKELIGRNQLEAVVLLPNKIFANTFVEVCFLVVRRSRERNAPIFLMDSSHEEETLWETKTRRNILGEKILQDYKERKGLLITREQIKKNDYSLSFTNYRERKTEGVLITELFDYFWSHDGGEILEHRSLEVKGTMFSNYLKKMQIAEKGEIVNKQVLYFYPKDGDGEKLEQLRDYLRDNYAEVRSFYTGAIIKHLRKDEFLKYFRINLLANSHNTDTRALGETEGIVEEN